MSRDYAAEWREERERARRKTLAAIERGNKPQTIDAVVTGFVSGIGTRYRGWNRTNVTDLYRDSSGYDVLMSYGTPIAYRGDDGAIYVSDVTYSPSTASHLGKLARPFIDAGYVMEYRDAQVIPTVVLNRGPGWAGGYETFQRWVKREHARDGQDAERDARIMGGVWVSPNGIWSIVLNLDLVGMDDIPATVLAYGRATMARIFWDGTVRAVTAKKIPDYVLRAVADNVPVIP